MCLVLIGRAVLSKSLIQFSVDVQGCIPSLLFHLRPNYGRGYGHLTEAEDIKNRWQEYTEELYKKRSS